MKTYLINHLRIPGDVPNVSALDYLDQVEGNGGGRWRQVACDGPGDRHGRHLAGCGRGADRVPKPGAGRQLGNNSAAYQKILPLRVHSAIADIAFIDELPDGFTTKAYAADIRRQVAGS